MATAAQVDAAVPTGAGQSPNRALMNALLKEMVTSGSTLRNVATRPSLCNSRNTANKQTMSRARLTAPINAIFPRFVFGNWWCDLSTGEAGSGAATTYTASIEYPAGTFTQVLFGGSASGVAPDLGEIISDEVPIILPANASFWVRVWTSNTAGILYIGKPEATAFGEAMEFGVTTPDKTMGGTVTAGGAGIVTPYAMIAMSSAPSFALLGDSRVFGQTDNYTGSYTNDVGILARSVGPAHPYINMGIPGDRAQIVAGSMTRRALLINRFCTSVISALGVNDINVNGRTAAQTYADLQTIWAALRPLPIAACTINPVSASTDAWATTANQTTAASNAQRVSLNNLLRGSNQIAALFDLADVVETTRDSGIWKAPGYTGDGLHELQVACVAIANSRAIDLGRLS